MSKKSGGSVIKPGRRAIAGLELDEALAELTGATMGATEETGQWEPRGNLDAQEALQFRDVVREGVARALGVNAKSIELDPTDE